MIVENQIVWEEMQAVDRLVTQPPINVCETGETQNTDISIPLKGLLIVGPKPTPEDTRFEKQKLSTHW